MPDSGSLADRESATKTPCARSKVACGRAPHGVTVIESDGVAGCSGSSGHAAWVPVVLASVVTVDPLTNSVSGVRAVAAVPESVGWDVGLPVAVGVCDGVHAADARGHATSVVPAIPSPVRADRISGTARSVGHSARASSRRS